MKLKNIRNKKGQAGLSGIPDTVWTVILIGIFIVIGIVVLSKLIDTTYDSASGSASNETLGSVNETGIDLSVSTYRSVSCTVGLVTNATDGVLIGATNYTATNCNLAFAPGGDTNFNNTAWNVTYSYSYEADSAASLAGNETITAVAEIPGWLSTIITLVITGIIITLVYFFRKKGQ